MSDEPVRHAGKVLGFRSWKLSGHNLAALYVDQPEARWGPGPNRARCLPGPLWPADRSHDAPGGFCSCGLYAMHELPPLMPLTWPERATVYGAVLAWGRIEVHAAGFRAEWAEPVVLAYSENQPYKHVRAVQAIGGELGLEVVELGRLPETARRHGEPIPERLRPRARELPPLRQPRATVNVPIATAQYAAALQAVGRISGIYARAFANIAGQLARARGLSPAELRARRRRLWVYRSIGLVDLSLAAANAPGTVRGSTLAAVVLCFCLAASVFFFRRGQQVARELR